MFVGQYNAFLNVRTAAHTDLAGQYLRIALTTGAAWQVTAAGQTAVPYLLAKPHVYAATHSAQGLAAMHCACQER